MKSANLYSRRRRQPASSRGFSLVELVVALAVAMVLAAIAIPNIVTTYSQYRLGVQATLIANEIDQLRMTAVRRNSTVTLLPTTNSSGNTVLYIDANKSNTYDATDPQVILPSDMQISNSGTPPTGMPGVSALPSTYSAAVSMTSTGIIFNANGTINNGAGPYFIVIGYTSTSKYGYRAITVTPMGQIKVWTASSGASSWSSSS